MEFPKPSDHAGPHRPDLRGCIDLHMHSTSSDGALEPEMLVEWAAHLGLAAMALTDHDTTAGVKRASKRGKELGVEVIPATEISVTYSGGTFHLLAYYINPDDATFSGKLASVIAGRKERNKKIVAALKSHGMEITEKELLDEAGEATVGRPHMARVLMRKGYVANFQEAFDKWLGEGKPCYFGYDSFGPKEAIELVLDAGGVPVIAHPFWLNRKNIEDLDDYIGQLKGFGLKGMEIIYSDHPPELQQEYRKIAEKRGMIVTGGSDFHGGTTKPEVTLGHGPGGGFHIPGDLLGPLKALAGVA